MLLAHLHRIAPPSRARPSREIKTKLIDTGKVRYIFHDFPLDQVALTAAMVARALPPERYEPFIVRAVRQPGPLGLRAAASTAPTRSGRWRRSPA